ncbi:MAG: hypothetical protein ACHQXA_06975 [Gemmatimonadales bacterium]
MQARPIVLAALTIGAFAAFTAAATMTTKYRIDITREAKVDLSAVGQPEQDQKTTTVAFLTVALTDTAGGRSVLAKVDSLRPDSALGVPQQTIDSARGASASAFLSAAGRVSSIKPLNDNAIAAGVFPLLNTLFPRIKGGAKVGDAWTDTLDYTSPTGQAGSVNVRMVANWVMMPDEMRDGQKARKVQAAYSLAQSGQLSGPAGEMNLAGTGTGSAIYWLNADGRLSGAQFSETGASTISSAQLPAPIPVKSTSSVTVTALK